MATTPGPDATLGFEARIKPLFRDRDRESMEFAFDLWSYADVSTNADAILDRVRSGTMPCDSRWPADQVDLFDQWIRAGKPR